MNRKGEVLTGIALTMFIATLAIGGGIIAKGTAETATNGQLTKNGQSIWAHMVGACAEGSTDSRCIMK